MEKCNLIRWVKVYSGWTCWKNKLFVRRGRDIILNNKIGCWHYHDLEMFLGRWIWPISVPWKECKPRSLRQLFVKKTTCLGFKNCQRSNKELLFFKKAMLAAVKARMQFGGKDVGNWKNLRRGLLKVPISTQLRTFGLFSKLKLVKEDPKLKVLKFWRMFWRRNGSYSV